MKTLQALSSPLLAFVLLAGCGAPMDAEPPDDPEPLVAYEPEAAAAVEPAAEDEAEAPAPAPAGDAPEPEAAAPVKKVLKYMWQGQQTGYWCGPGSTRIAISTRKASPPSQATLAKFMGTTVNGTDHIGLVRSALNHYLGTSWFETKVMYDPPTQAQRNLLKRDVLLNIDSGYPLVANVISGWRPPGYPGGTIYHYVAVVGYDQRGNRVLIADPAGEGAGGSGWRKVPRTYWISIWDLGTWIGGKGYAA